MPSRARSAPSSSARPTTALARGALRRALLAAAVGLAATPGARAQRPASQLDSAAILHRMHELEVLGSVLYVAAHPDDENTRLISHLSNGLQVRTAYLSLTRGDGGQNLIGAEIGDPLGVLRTQELLEARRIDGGEQFFTRAVDFGYSKTPEETFAKWGRAEVLGDVVRVIRTFRPDAIVTRFATDGSGTHGHHTASALLAHEAFDLAADPQAFPEQVAAGLEPWRTKRLFFNASTWWRKDLPEVAEKEPDRWVRVDVGGYDPLLGASYSEVAGRSRSQHKSQGFGSAESRGELIEYLRLEKGEPLAGPSILDGVETGWARVDGGERAAAALRDLVAAYDPAAPERSAPGLIGLARTLDELAATRDPDRHWARHHAAAARELALQACGVVLEATAPSPRVATGDTIAVTLSALARRPGAAIELVGFVAPDGARVEVGLELPANRAVVREHPFAPSASLPVDEPYWLAGPHGALYRPDLGRYAGIEPASRASATFRAELRTADGTRLEVELAALHKWVDRVDGERLRPLVVAPPASIAVQDPVVLVRGERASVAVEVEALADGLDGALTAVVPPGWTVERAPEPVERLRRGERQLRSVELRKTPDARRGVLRWRFDGPKGSTERELRVIDAPHVLPQTWYAPAEVVLVPEDVHVTVARVGYVDGAGDDVPAALRRLGVEVLRVDPATARAEDLAACDAIVTGVRAYNTVPALARFQRELLAWVERGGTLVVQYNTNGSDLVLDAKRIGPFPFSITRQRVTVEEAAPAFLVPEHPLLSRPNRLEARDFEGWVQERGIYFAGDLAPQYAAPIAWSDPGEEPASGALIACDHGRGRFVYTGLSLFRQLPAGVPGAYRLLANMIARRGEGE